MLDFQTLLPAVSRVAAAVQNVTEKTPSRRITLDGLPEELLACIALELDLQGLISARATCRLFNRICSVDDLAEVIPAYGWYHITKTTAFFLSKPLQDCSAKDLENDLRRWETGWSPRRSVDFSKRRITTSKRGGLFAKMSTVFLLPGGRWLISGYDDGSVWYFDLSEPLEPKERLSPRPLLPPPFAGMLHEGDIIQIQVSIDFTSDQALGASTDSHHLE